MNPPRLRESHRHEMQLAGSYRLAQAVYEALSLRGSMRSASAYLLELLPALFNAKAVKIELSNVKSYSWCDGQTDLLEIGTDVRGVSTVVVPLIAQSKNFGQISLILPNSSAEIGPQGLAFLNFVASCFAGLAQASLSFDDQSKRLTPAEKRVLSLFMLPTSEIIDRLNISRETFRVHCKHIYKKLGVHSRSEALLAARQFGDSSSL